MKIVNLTDRTLKISIGNKVASSPDHVINLFNVKSGNGKFTEHENIDLSLYDMMIIKYSKE